MRAMLEVSTDYGYDIAIYEEDLEGITASERWKLRVSRPMLKRCFSEGVMLMQGKTENDRVRPCAYPISGGKVSDQKADAKRSLAVAAKVDLV